MLFLLVFSANIIWMGNANQEDGFIIIISRNFKLYKFHIGPCLF